MPKDSASLFCFYCNHAVWTAGTAANRLLPSVWCCAGSHDWPGDSQHVCETQRNPREIRVCMCWERAPLITPGATRWQTGPQLQVQIWRICESRQETAKLIRTERARESARLSNYLCNALVDNYFFCFCHTVEATRESWVQVWLWLVGHPLSSWMNHPLAWTLWPDACCGMQSLAPGNLAKPLLSPHIGEFLIVHTQIYIYIYFWRWICISVSVYVFLFYNKTYLNNHCT